MEQNLPVIAKRIWETVRVIFFMLRKGISKRKLLVDLNMMLKRGNKIATKAIGNLMFHHHDHHRNISFPAPPQEYEFSCSNTPMYSLPFHVNKRRHHNHHHNNFFSCAFHAPPTLDDDVTTMNAVKLALEMLNNNNNEVMVEASPMLPGFGRSPMVRQLRITDSPFPLRDVDDDNGIVDKKAEEFIERFYKELRQQQKK
ncbi:uncharacterized protein LOC110612689 [Manihot esculenta]|uniref:Avr9/Cf-9 rapidly elicited protein 146 n=1 Tax=Manihot esculenta TaxID=3983 RepID=A0A2C9W4P9_MANES|nr:uncharacterized protein LOC110612689 [Manihot esculenta]OAY53067.1 hypothetical protein MANES_04G133200v8 [Manihot esculenta]